MARFRLYKNGVYGSRYRGYYIAPSGKSAGHYSVLSPTLEPVYDEITGFSECRWEIDKLTASDAELRLVRRLYDTDISQLTKMMIELFEKGEAKGLDESTLESWIEKVRSRKARNLPY